MKNTSQIDSLEHIIGDDFIISKSELPQTIQTRVDKQIRFLLQKPNHPSLYLKKIKVREKTLWSIRITHNYRALGKESDGTVTWYWVGHHRKYDRLIRT